MLFLYRHKLGLRMLLSRFFQVFFLMISLVVYAVDIDSDADATLPVPSVVIL